MAPIHANPSRNVTWKPAQPSAEARERRAGVDEKFGRSRDGAQGFFRGLFSGSQAATPVQHRSAPTGQISKKQVCDQIYRISREVIHQVDDQPELGGAGLKEACERLAECGHNLLSLSEGKGVRSGIRKWLNGFEANYKNLIENNSPKSHDAIANLCFNYSEQLDRLAGVIRPLRPAASNG